MEEIYLFLLIIYFRLVIVVVMCLLVFIFRLVIFIVVFLDLGFFLGLKFIGFGIYRWMEIFFIYEKVIKNSLYM